MYLLDKSPKRKGERNIHRNKQGGVTKILENTHRKSPRTSKVITMKSREIQRKRIIKQQIEKSREKG